MNGKIVSAFAVIGICCLFVFAPTSIWAQKPPPLAKPNPLAPTLNTIFPGGMQRGTTTTLTLTGARLQDVFQVLIDFPAKISILDDKAKKTGTSLRVKFDAPKDAPVGPFTIRVVSKLGISNPQLFCIDDLKQIVEKSNTKDKPQTLAIPCVVAGRIEAQRSDFYRFSAKRGQTLSFDLIGRRLGNPSDPQLTIYNAATQRELVHVNDSPGCQTDPRFTFIVPEDGDYLVEVRDLLFRGGGDYVYQLRVGDFPCVTAPVPMAAQRGAKLNVGFAGIYLTGVKPVSQTIPNDKLKQTIALTAVNDAGRNSWPVSLHLSDYAETVEKEPNDKPSQANTAAVPSGVTGRFEMSNDADLFRFTAKKGQKIRIQAHTSEFHSPTLVYMRVLDGKAKKELAKTNPQAAPPSDQRIDFTAPADGSYFVDVQHLNYIGGPEQIYRLTFEPIQPDFDLSMDLDRFDAAIGSVVPLKISVSRKAYTGAIKLDVVKGSPFTGTGEIAAGRNDGVLVVNCPDKASLGAHFVTVVGSAVVDGKTKTRPANVRAAISQELSNLRFPPHSFLYRVALTARERGPFRLTAKLKTDKRYRGSTAVLTVSAVRDKDFSDAIALASIAGLPPNVTIPKKLPAIAKGKTETSINVVITAKTPMGIFPMVVAGQGKVGKTTFSEYSTPATLSIERPFTLKLDSRAVNLKQGEKTKLKVSVTRNAGYTGPVSLELPKLPGNVSAKKIVVAAGKTGGEIEIVAAANAAVGEKKDLRVLGTATGAANQQASSAPIALRISKK